MEVNKEQSRSHLYLLRLWSEDENNLQGEWSARIQHVFSGETHTFQACPQIVDVLLKLSGGEERGQAKEAHGY
ncbi:MAG: hypothetical protein WCD37_11985 [Chloroflexia bacterium]